MKIKTIAITISILLLFLNLNGWYSFNSGGNAFQDQYEEGTKSSDTLDKMIIIAAGHFLQSNSDYQVVLKKIELSETGVIDSINQTIQSITAANAKYFEIWNTSLSLEYDPIVIEKLSQFDYTGYKLENNLNPVIFQRLEGFLRQGHVREIFQQAFIDSSKILETLKEIRAFLESGEKVDISRYWRLNQMYLEFALFGQYASEVFIKMD
jgi:hypothetical protein